MEDDLIFYHGRQFNLEKRKTTSILCLIEDGIWYMEDDLNILENGRRPQYFLNGRRPQYFWKWKTTSIFLKLEADLNIFKMEDDLNIFENGR